MFSVVPAYERYVIFIDTGINIEYKNFNETRILYNDDTMISV